MHWGCHFGWWWNVLYLDAVLTAHKTAGKVCVVTLRPRSWAQVIFRLDKVLTIYKKYTDIQWLCDKHKLCVRTTNKTNYPFGLNDFICLVHSYSRLKSTGMRYFSPQDNLYLVRLHLSVLGIEADLKSWNCLCTHSVTDNDLLAIANNRKCHFFGL